MAQDDDRVRIRIAEIMSGAGLGYNQIALEVLYMLPREFINRYIELFGEAYGPVVRAPGDGMARDGQLGKAATQTRLKGIRVGAGAGGGGKRIARVFGMRNEDAFRLKERVDKRLRGISRDIREELLTINDRGVREVGVSEEGVVVMQCKKCGRIMTRGFKFCPYDASILIDPQLIEEAHLMNASMIEGAARLGNK